MAIISDSPRVPLANPEFFPLDALGSDLARFVEEIHFNTQAPISAIVAVIIAAISVVCQGRINVLKPSGGLMPPSLWFFVVMESGERKSTIFREIFKAILDYSEEKSTVYAEKMAVYQASHSAWSARNKGVADRLRKKAAKGDDTQSEVVELAEHALRKPIPPRGVKLVFENVTPAALLKSVADNCPTVALVSSEAASIFNGRIFSDLGVLNKSWDADGASIVRVADDISIPSFCLTFLILAQEGVLNNFLKTKGELLQSSGMIPRAFVFKPISLVGERYLNGGAGCSCYYSAWFYRRCREILDDSFDGNNVLKTEKAILQFSPEAKNRWVSEYNNIERMMAEGGCYFSVKYIASRLPEKIARLSALLHYFEGGNGPINIDCLNRAISICTWFVNQMIDYLHPSGAAYQNESDAEILERWLIQRYSVDGKNCYFRNDLLQIGPNPLRLKSKLYPAIEVLVQQGKIAEYIPDGSKAAAIWLNDSYFHFAVHRRY